MLKTVLKTIAASIVALGITATAYAVPFTLTNSQLITMTPTVSPITASLDTLNNKFALGGVKFAGEIVPNPLNTYAQVEYSFTPGTALDLSTFDSFDLLFMNKNENTWQYSLFVSDGTSSFSSALVGIAKETDGIVSLDLSSIGSVNPANITKMGFSIGGNLPLPGDDYVFETIVVPTPEPGTIALLGVGLLAIPLVRRKIKK